MTRITLLAALGSNRVIGRDGEMPWHLPEDLKHYKHTTMGHPLVMGRKTFESIGRALPGRRTIVITRQQGWSHPGVEAAHSLPEALSLAWGRKVEPGAAVAAAERAAAGAARQPA